MCAPRPDGDSSRTDRFKASMAMTHAKARALTALVRSACGHRHELSCGTLEEYRNWIAVQCRVDPVLRVLMAQLGVAYCRDDCAGRVEVKRLLRFIKRWQASIDWRDGRGGGR